MEKKRSRTVGREEKKGKRVAELANVARWGIASTGSAWLKFLGWGDLSW